MDYTKCSTSAIKCMVGCLSHAILNYKNIEGIDIGDIESLREGLEILISDSKSLLYLDAMLQIKNGNEVHAISILRELLSFMPDYPSAKGLLAFTLCSQNDPNWESVANEMIENKNASEDDIEMVHTIWKSNWMRKGTWSEEKAQSLDQERAIRFQKNTAHQNNKEEKNDVNIIQPYAIRM